MTAASPLISVRDLQGLMGDPDLVLLDVRWQLGQTDGHERYLAGHLPGAVFVDLDAELADAPAPTCGRHPLPQVANFARAVQGWGVNRSSTVVIYDDWKSMAAARAWWLLDAAGHPSVRVLDGGIRAWQREGLGLETGSVEALPAASWVEGFGDRVLDADGAAELASSGVLIDARAAERYDGSTEPIDPRAGHIPGAISAPTTQNVDADGVFLPVGRLLEQFSALGMGPESQIGVYCGSGVTASHEILALRAAGLDASLYAGSWSQWSNLDRPVAVGSEPGA